VPKETVGRAAKRITGYSIETLNKVAQIRELAGSDTVSAELRAAAESCLHRLARPGASVHGAYRSLLALQQQLLESARPVAQLRAPGDTDALERVLEETSVLAAQLAGPLASQLASAARQGKAEREMLRATRTSLASCLATVVAIECELEPQPLHTLRRIAAEVSRMLSVGSRQHIQAHIQAHNQAHGQAA
jgi:hypothetical protein